MSKTVYTNGCDGLVAFVLCLAKTHFNEWVDTNCARVLQRERVLPLYSLWLSHQRCDVPGRVLMLSMEGPLQKCCAETILESTRILLATSVPSELSLSNPPPQP
eukprot:6288643-Amphidinium_carterae.1